MGETLERLLINQAELGRLPDAVIRLGIRQRHRRVLQSQQVEDVSRELEQKKTFIQEMNSGPIAAVPELANFQHYDVPAEFFQLMLGPLMKYSCCLFKDGGSSTDLSDAEEDMLCLVASRAGLEDGMDVLDLGCGWGSFSLWLAQKHRNSKIKAVSNAQNQVDFINRKAQDQGLQNLRAERADMNIFHPQTVFDRIISVEMFEHMRNWRLLIKRISGWLKPSGSLFVHIFVHEKFAYFFNQGPGDWMGKHFFSGGMMPSDDLMFYFQDQMRVRGHWRINGLQYSLTLEKWLRRLDSNRQVALKVLDDALPPGTRDSPDVLLQRWRMFLMACSELFAWNRGNAWFISHYLLSMDENTS